MENSALIFWIVAAVVLAVVELSTANLLTVWFAVGALCSAVAAGLGAPLWVQLVVFVVVSAAVLALTKPLVKKLRRGNPESTNADRIIGKEAVVEAEIDPTLGTGQVRVLGQIWSAKGTGDAKIEKGVTVTVTGIEGVKAVVAEKEE